MIRWESDKKLWRYGLPKCQHPDVRAVLVVKEGRRGIREQCLGCGKLDTAPLKLADHPDAPEVVQYLADDWQKMRDDAAEASGEAAKRRFAMRQSARKEESADWWEGYNEYLNGDDWAHRREAILHRDSGRCQAMLPGCTRKATEVHHLSYALHRSLGAAPLWDLTAICHECHEKITEAERKMRADAKGGNR